MEGITRYSLLSLSPLHVPWSLPCVNEQYIAGMTLVIAMCSSDGYALVKRYMDGA